MKRGPLVEIKVIGVVNVSMDNPKVFQNNALSLKLLHFFHIQCHSWAVQDASRQGRGSLGRENQVQLP